MTNFYLHHITSFFGNHAIEIIVIATEIDWQMERSGTMNQNERTGCASNWIVSMMNSLVLALAICWLPGSNAFSA
jgi:hypothetical protein